MRSPAPASVCFSRQHNNVDVAASVLLPNCFSHLRRQVRLGVRLPEDLPLLLQHNQMQQCDTRVSAGDGPQR